MRALLSLFLFLGLALPASAAEPVNPIVIEEWPVPFEHGRPRDPYVAPDGSVWFVGQQNSYLARFDPKTNKFFQRDLGDGAGPHNLIVGADGIVWYAGNRRGYIGRYDPKTDKIDKIVMPDSAARDPHTLIFDQGEKHIWFTVQWGNFVGRLRLTDRKVDLVAVPTEDSRPYGIIVAPDGTPWIALLGTNKLASVDPRSLTLTEHELPELDAAPRRIAATSDGRIYYTDYSRGTLGRLDPKTGKAEEWAAPAGGGSGPYAMAADGGDRIWYVETGERPNTFVGFSPDGSATFSVTPVPSGAGSVRHMVYDAAAEAVWFGTDAGTIGRAQLPPGRGFRPPAAR